MQIFRRVSKFDVFTANEFHLVCCLHNQTATILRNSACVALRNIKFRVRGILLANLFIRTLKSMGTCATRARATPPSAPKARTWDEWVGLGSQTFDMTAFHSHAILAIEQLRRFHERKMCVDRITMRNLSASGLCDVDIGEISLRRPGPVQNLCDVLSCLRVALSRVLDTHPIWLDILTDFLDVKLAETRGVVEAPPCEVYEYLLSHLRAMRAMVLSPPPHKAGPSSSSL